MTTHSSGGMQIPRAPLAVDRVARIKIKGEKRVKSTAKGARPLCIADTSTAILCAIPLVSSYLTQKMD